jgi:hypothetical protein
MSDAGEIDVRDLAMMVREIREKNNSTAQSVATINLVYAFWDSLGQEPTDPDLAREEARAILNELPTSYEDEHTKSEETAE